MQTFKTSITKIENERLIYIKIPFDAKKEFSVPKGTIFVTGNINDIPYRNKLVSRGNGQFIMVINKDLQKKLKFDGTTLAVDVTMEHEAITNPVSTEVKPTISLEKQSAIEAILHRRSIRKYTAKLLDEDLINTILYAGFHAPTAKNKQPIHFIIIKEKDKLNQLATTNNNATMLAEAPCCIVVCGDQNIEGMVEFLHADCAAATQNMLLCIHELGLGGVWCGVAKNSEWYKLLITTLNLPEKIIPFSVIPIGYPDEKKEPKAKWNASKVHQEQW